MTLTPLLFSLLRLSIAPIDSCPPTPPTGPAPAWFEFQVDRRARFTNTDSTIPRPDESLTERGPQAAEFALVQFMVDTAGVPVTRSFRVLRRPTGLSDESVTTAMQGWRYEPAMARGCKVPQLVQTPLRWK